MQTVLSEGSNTLDLITWIQEQQGSTFAERCRTAIRAIDAVMLNLYRGSGEWNRLARTKGQVEGFIRHDRDGAVDWEYLSSAYAPAAIAA